VDALVKSLDTRRAFEQADGREPRATPHVEDAVLARKVEKVSASSRISSFQKTGFTRS